MQRAPELGERERAERRACAAPRGARDRVRNSPQRADKSRTNGPIRIGRDAQWVLFSCRIHGRLRSARDSPRQRDKSPLLLRRRGGCRLVVAGRHSSRSRRQYSSRMSSSRSSSRRASGLLLAALTELEVLPWTRSRGGTRSVPGGRGLALNDQRGRAQDARAPRPWMANPPRGARGWPWRGSWHRRLRSSAEPAAPTGLAPRRPARGV